MTRKHQGHRRGCVGEPEGDAAPGLERSCRQFRVEHRRGTERRVYIESACSEETWLGQGLRSGEIAQLQQIARRIMD